MNRFYRIPRALAISGWAVGTGNGMESWLAAITPMAQMICESPVRMRSDLPVSIFHFDKRPYLALNSVPAEKW
jgi:hypothetical protein